MKTIIKLIVVAAFLLATGLTYGQGHIQAGATGESGDIYHLGGNVGIGRIPSVKLDVLGEGINLYSNTPQNTLNFGRGQNQQFKFFVDDNNGYMDYIQDADNNATHVFFIRNLAEGTSPNNDIRFQTSSLDRLTIKANGNIGIGTDNPNSKLEVGVKHAINQDEEMRIGSYYNNNFYGLGLNYRISPEGGVSKHFVEYSNGNKHTVMTFKDGNVAMFGKLEAEEIKVTTTPTADFVFEEDYALKDLTEVEAFVKENKHLPDIASAKKMQEQGVNMGEFQIQLLQKIEELTLYVIEQDKRIEKLENENSLLKQKN